MRLSTSSPFLNPFSCPKLGYFVICEPIGMKQRLNITGRLPQCTSKNCLPICAAVSEINVHKRTDKQQTDRISENYIFVPSNISTKGINCFLKKYSIYRHCSFTILLYVHIHYFIFGSFLDVLKDNMIPFPVKRFHKRINRNLLKFRFDSN